MKESTRRISELVTSVKSYTQMDRASMQRIDVTEGLESTLVMLGHRLREGGVTVVRDYCSEVPEVEAYPGELNQVWTNLIDNAVDAMEGQGTLTIRTQVSPDRVVVEIADDGHGMDPATAERAFEAFFTTKEVGKGTGWAWTSHVGSSSNGTAATFTSTASPGGRWSASPCRRHP